MMLLALAATPEATANAALEPAEERPLPFLYSARGPGEGRAVIGVGGRAFFVLPTFDGAYAYGISDRLSFQTDLSSILLFNSGNLGLQYRLIGGPGQTLSVAVNAGLTAHAWTALLASSVGAGLKPGIVISLGGDNVQFSLSAALPIYLVGSTSVLDDPGDKTSSRPAADLMPNLYATLEFSSFYLQLGLYDAISFPHEEHHSVFGGTTMSKLEQSYVPAIAFGGRFNAF